MPWGQSLRGLKKVVIHGLPTDTDILDIKNELCSLGFEVHRISPMRNFIKPNWPIRTTFVIYSKTLHFQEFSRSGICLVVKSASPTSSAHTASSAITLKGLDTAPISDPWIQYAWNVAAATATRLVMFLGNKYVVWTVGKTTAVTIHSAPRIKEWLRTLKSLHYKKLQFFAAAAENWRPFGVGRGLKSCQHHSAIQLHPQHFVFVF